jgi:transcriptional regulator with XRE-family HTH domain
MMETVVRTFDPERMKAARRRANMSQRDLADRSGIPVTMIQEYEQGKSIPSVPRLFIIADTLKCSADDLAS